MILPRLDTIHLWWGWLDPSSWSIPLLRKLLSSAEMKRAGQYAFATDQQAFILRRGLLRLVLAHSLDAQPASLCIHESPMGKPFVRLEANQGPLEFSLSSANGLAVIACAPFTVGVDILATGTQISSVGDRRVFTAEERAWLLALHAERQPDARLLLWGCKEAVVKATGLGMRYPLAQINVSLDAKVANLSRESVYWDLSIVPIPQRYVVVLAYSQGVLRREIVIQPIASLVKDPRANTTCFGLSHAGAR